MKKLSLLVALIFASTISNGQITLENAYPNQSWKCQMVNLKNSGRKYMIQEYDTSGTNASSIKLYNLDHTLWKTINAPNVTGFRPYEVFYVSEDLFALDGKVYAAYIYGEPGVTLNYGKCIIIDENGTILKQIDNATSIKIYDAGSNKFKAIVGKFKSGSQYRYNEVYSLPGTIPNSLGNGLGLAKKSKLSEPYPNPSTSEVRIEYSLPNGTNEGIIAIYSTNGVKLKSFKVDRSFKYITVDNSELPTGTYFYNIETNKGLSETKKMLVIK